MSKQIYIIPESEYLDSNIKTIREVIREELELYKNAKQVPSQQTTKYLTRKETAKLLRISLPTLGEYVKRGIIKSKKMGARVLFNENDIKEAIHTIETKVR